MTPSKRFFDVILALLLLVTLMPVILFLIVVLILTQGRPVFYVAERMRSASEGFPLWKFRTMRVQTGDRGVSGGDKSSRVTPMGRILRRTRLDELPQLYNILRGDMSFVGPRPPLREYVERFPTLYARVLHSRPGVTGLATLVYHRHEERLLAACKTPAQTDAVYSRICVPWKARLDMIYQHRRSLCMDIWLIGRTMARLIPRRAS